MDDNDIVRLVDSTTASDSSLIQISEDTIVKLGRTFSLSTSEGSRWTLYAPRQRSRFHVHRVIRHLHDEGDGLIVMDLVKNACEATTHLLVLSFIP